VADENYAQQTVRRAREAEQASPSGRLPVPSYASWESFPYEGELQVRPVSDVVLPEPPRHGEGGVDCHACAAQDEQYVWTDEHWRLRSTAEPTGLPVVLLLEPREHVDLHDLPVALRAGMGDLLCRVEAAITSLGGIARVHVSRIGDGAEHLHWWFMARPEGLVQARGSFAVEWDDLLPPRPRDQWEADLQRVAAAMRG
jgi:diadenosine tetraphosphate (Ap4A) HIT family hydrolase